jgi:SAM-dependent methyltransferase
MDDADDPIKRHAKKLFGSLVDPWPEHDRWSTHTRKSIARFLNEFVSNNDRFQSPADVRLLNVGSHGNAYSLQNGNHFHTDIAEEALTNVSLACVADAERLPFLNEAFDVVLCVGSVINYCTAARAIGEMGRVLRPGGQLLLEFETSESLEFALTRDLNKDVTIVRTFYNGSLENLYVYSSRYIAGALNANGLTIDKSARFHVVSPLTYRISRNERFAAIFSFLDNLARKLPGLRNYSANILLSAQKTQK